VWAPRAAWHPELTMAQLHSLLCAWTSTAKLARRLRAMYVCFLVSSIVFCAGRTVVHLLPFPAQACQDTVKSVVLAASELLEDVKGRTAALEASGDKCKQLCQETLSDPGSALRNCQILNDLYDANRSKHVRVLLLWCVRLRAHRTCVDVLIFVCCAVYSACHVGHK
jgi:hypothetical protein